MNEQEFDKWLDERANALPRSIEPPDDLWPGIEARIAQDRGAGSSTAGRPWSRVWPFAAGMAATALVAIMTLQIIRQAPDAPTEPQTAERLDPVDSGRPIQELVVEEPAWVNNVRLASNDLRADYEASLDNLSPETRAVVEENLAQIHDSLAKIHEALSKDPSNAALHRLLAGTYQQELSLFSSIGALNTAEVEL